MRFLATKKMMYFYNIILINHLRVYWKINCKVLKI